MVRWIRRSHKVRLVDEVGLGETEAPLFQVRQICMSAPRPVPFHL